MVFIFQISKSIILNNTYKLCSVKYSRVEQYYYIFHEEKLMHHGLPHERIQIVMDDENETTHVKQTYTFLSRAFTVLKYVTRFVHCAGIKFTAYLKCSKLASIEKIG